MQVALLVLAIIGSLVSLGTTLWKVASMSGRMEASAEHTAKNFDAVCKRLDAVEDTAATAKDLVQYDKRLSDVEGARTASVARHELEQISRRLETLEHLNRAAITREELDARFSGVRHDIKALDQTVSNVFGLLKELLAKPGL